MRVVTLLTSATELVCLAGGGGALVGRSHECDFGRGPGAGGAIDLSEIQTLTKPKAAFDLAGGMTAAEVDRVVSEAIAEEGSGALYDLDVESLVGLAPDLIVTQDLCSVCSIDLNAVGAAADEIERRGGKRPEILSLNPETLEDVIDDLLRVGHALDGERLAEAGSGLSDRGGMPERVGVTTEGRHATIAKAEAVRLRERLFRAEEFVNPYTGGGVVGFLEWTEPIFVAGHWTVQMIERAGGVHPWNETRPVTPADGAALGPQRGARRAGKSIRVSSEVFAAVGPEALIVAPCGLSLDQAWAEVERLHEAEAWFRSLPAVRSGWVAVVDGNQMFNRPGPRLFDAFEWLAGWLNGRPEIMPDGFPWRVFRD